MTGTRQRVAFFHARPKCMERVRFQLEGARSIIQNFHLAFLKYDICPTLELLKILAPFGLDA